MKLPEAMAALGDPARQNEAGRLILEQLRELARTLIPKRDDQLRDDVVNRVALNLISKFGVGRADPPRHPAAYLRRCITNEYMNAHRMRLRRKEVPEVPEQESPFERDPAATSKQLFESLSRLLEEAAEARSGVHGQALRRDARELIEIAAGESTMEDALRREGLTDASSNAEAKRLRNRLLKRHSRTRAELHDALAGLHDRGEIDDDTVHVLRTVLNIMLRCQKRPGSDVSSDEGST